jgi:lysophospholipase L1-like esterase
MMNLRFAKILPVFVAACLVAGCGPDISGNLNKKADAGRADFSTYVAVGDSLTAGYADGALYRSGQVDSFPAILAQQFALAGGGAFTQPLMPTGATGSLFLGMTSLGRPDRLVLAATGNPASPVSPVPITPAISSDIATESIPGMYNNTGVPGAKVFHVAVAGYGNPLGLPASANPYFVRFASTTAASMLSDALAQGPSFFTLWIGSNDILFYALAGGDAVDQNAADNISPGTYGSNDITDDLVFAGAYNAIVGALKTVTNKGVLINIPAVSNIPHFTTVPYNAIPLTTVQAQMLQAGLGDPYNAGLDVAVAGMAITQAEADRRYLNFSGGQNPVLITDEEGLTDLTGSAIPSMRHATSQDFIVLPASAKIGVDSGGQYGVSVPLVDADILTQFEVASIEVARSAYNATIKAVADADPDLVLLDAAALLEELNSSGISYGSGGVSSTFAQGGAFSLDGVHPTARGYAVIANEIFKVINTGFDAYIPPVDPSDYTTVFYQ